MKAFEEKRASALALEAVMIGKVLIKKNLVILRK
jgi:hypothetical protein